MTIRAVTENRARCAKALRRAPQNLVTLYQIHSAPGLVDEPWSGRNGPQADGMVTKDLGIALGVLAADCMPFPTSLRRVIGAAHAGWCGRARGRLLKRPSKP
ncbi:MAG: laccase domain-containing protein [Parvularculaceae bacterium]